MAVHKRGIERAIAISPECVRAIQCRQGLNQLKLMYGMCICSINIALSAHQSSIAATTPLSAFTNTSLSLDYRREFETGRYRYL